MQNQTASSDALALQPPVNSSGGSVGYAPNTDEGRAVLQLRLGIFARTLLVLTAAYAAFLIILRLGVIGGQPQPVGSALALAAAAVVLLAVIAVMTAQAPLPARTLLALDLLGTLAPTLFMGGSAFIMFELPIAQVGAFVGTALKVFGRTLFVPSTARRTTWITIAACTPVLLANVLIAVFRPEDLLAPRSLQLGFLVLWSGALCALAGYGSGLLYELRRAAAQARVLGQYVLLAKIGEGGMGVVYRARHALLRRDTAVKLLPPDKAGAENIRRFEHEVQHAAALTHPNTIAIYDYGRSVDGIFYYAMEMLEGMDLEVLTTTYGAQPPGRVIHMLSQACAALSEAHTRGLVHRDIKPSNIFLTCRAGVPDVVKVLDFGLVRDFVHVDESAHDARSVMGTPAYMSPESIQTPHAVGPASDLYAMGVSAYFLLTQRLPFDADSPVQMLARHIANTPRAPSLFAPTPLSKELDALILNCLAKTPEGRPASAMALKRALEALPEASSWDEEKAHAWWQYRTKVESRGKAATTTVQALEQAATMAVDVVAR